MYILHDYQESAFNKILKAFMTQIAVLIVMATGLGKTLISAFFAEREYRQKKIGLFICHENDILDQAFDEYREVFGKEAVLRKFYGKEKDWNADKADVLFASFQSFKDWHNVFDPKHFDYIVVDESHHGQAPTYKEVIEYFQPEKLLGMTATPDREDEKDIREIFGNEVVNYTLEEALAKGWLTEVEYHIKNDGINTQGLKNMLKNVLEENKRVSIKQLNETIFIKKRDEEIAREIYQDAKGKKTIIFCESIAHANNFVTFLPNAAVFHCGIKNSINKQVLQSFRDGKLDFILAINKMNEGIDIPDAEMIVFLRSTDSLTVFLQQLGRGLRKLLGKKKVIIHDYVANCQRLLYLAEVGKKVKEFSGNGFMLSKDSLHVSGRSFDFIFTDLQVDILSILSRLKREFYLTWQEASAAAIKLGLRTKEQYRKGRFLDPKLPGYPNETYDDFPGFGTYLGTGRQKRKRDNKNYYPTWQEASRAAITLGLRTAAEYIAGYHVDPRLPLAVEKFYKDFPGYSIFLDKKYITWQEASQAAKDLGITSCVEYGKLYHLDRKLPSAPWAYYDDCPAIGIFFGTGRVRRKRETKNYYSTWMEAKTAIESLRKKYTLVIRNKAQYHASYRLDERLPGYPNEYYKDFPGYKQYLGSGFYPTWQEASEKAIELKAVSKRDYYKKYIQDLRLPHAPDSFYKDFPGWDAFLGKRKIKT